MTRRPSPFSGLRPLLRIELREMRRNLRRSLLVVLLVAVPVAAISGASTLMRAIQMSPEDHARQALGRADLRVEGFADRAGLEAVEDALPPGSRTQGVVAGLERVQAPGVELRARLLALSPDALSPVAVSEDPSSDVPSPDALADGILSLREGRMPRNAGEVALSPSLLDALGRRPGDAVTLEYGGLRTIVGVVVDPEDTTAPVVVRRPAVAEHPGRRFLLVDLPPGSEENTTSALRQMDAPPQLHVTTRDEAAVGDAAVTAFIFALGTLGLFECALVISAAFGISFRRRQVELGLLGSVGAEPPRQVQSLLFGAALLATLGGLLGVACGVSFVAAIYPWLEVWTGRLVPPFAVVPVHLVAAVALGVAAAVSAAYLPARGAARLPVREALSGRRPSQRSPRPWLLASLALLAASLVLLALARVEHPVLRGLGVILGPIVGLLGFGAAAPWLLEISTRRAAGLPPAWRLAVRDAGRFRRRNAAVITAVLAGMAMSVTLASLVQSIETAVEALPLSVRDDQLRIDGPGSEAVARSLAEELPVAAAAPLRAVYLHGEPLRGRVGGESPDRRHAWVAAGDEALVRALGADAGLDAFARGQVLALDVEASGAVEFRTWLSESSASLPPVFAVDTRHPLREPVFVIRHDRLTGGLSTGPPPRSTLVPWLVRLDQPVSADLLQRARRLAAAAPQTRVDAARLQSSRFRDIYYVVFLLSLVTGLITVLTAVSLSAAESAPDERVLESLGAPPRLLRAHKAARASFLALLGCVLAVPGGLMAAAALEGAVNFPLDLALPWGDLGLIALGLPTLVYGVVWLTAGGGRRRRRGGSRPAGGLLRRGLLRRGLLRRGLLRRSRPLLVVFVLLSPTGDSAADSPRPSATPSATVPQARDAQDLHRQPYTGRAFDGSPVQGEIGRVAVPVNRSRPDGAHLEIAFVRYATTHPEPGPPVFVLAGGPGGSGIDEAAILASHPQIRLLEQRDVIGVDQRGTGRTGPALTENVPTQESPRSHLRTFDRDVLVEASKEAAATTASHWRRRGVDLASFNTRESADDLDAVRRALGLPQIALWGASYGSHLGLTYLRRHGEHVERAIFLRLEGPDHTFKLPSQVQARLEHLHRLAAGDDTASHLLEGGLLEVVARRLHELERQPLRVELDARALHLGPLDLQIAVARSLGSIEAISELPARLRRLEEGDGRWLAEQALDHRQPSVHALVLAMDCASGASAERHRRLQAEAADPANLLQDALLAPLYPEACRSAGIAPLDPTFREPVHHDAPILLVSGTLDARTPPTNAEELLPTLPGAVHVVVENAAHESREWMSPEFRDLVQAFLRGEDVAPSRVRLPEPIFASEVRCEEAVSEDG